MNTYERLTVLINSYFAERPLKKPDTKDAAMFLVTEVGEFLDALLRKEDGWTRNHEKDTDPVDELADCLMMLIVCSQCLEADVFEVLETILKNKLEKLGQALSNPNP